MRKNKHLQTEKRSVSAYFIRLLCNIYKIKRLSSTCIYSKNVCIIKSSQERER